MADTDIIVSQLPNASQVGNSDLVMLTQPNAQAETGYSTAKTTVGAVATKILGDTEYVTDLPSFPEGKQNPFDALLYLRDSILDLLPVDEVSGAVANFETDVVLPLIDVKAEIKAVETGTGAKSPSNPYVISGFSEAVISHSGEDMTNPTTYTFAFGQTVYGGELDVINGKLKITHRAFAFSGSENWNKSTNFFYLSAGTIAETPIQENVIGSNGFTINPMTNGQVRLYPSYGINSQYLSMDSTNEDINGYLSNGIIFLYRLVTPIEVDLTPQAIMPFLGVNNIWNDTNGDTTVKYKLGIQKYIDKKIAQVQALVL